MDSREEYPFYTEDALRKRDRRHPTVPLEDVWDILETDGLTVLQYLRMHHGHLSNEEMALVALHIESGLTFAEIGRCLGVSGEAVRTRLRRILAKIAE